MPVFLFRLKFTVCVTNMPDFQNTFFASFLVRAAGTGAHPVANARTYTVANAVAVVFTFSTTKSSADARTDPAPNA